MLKINDLKNKVREIKKTEEVEIIALKATKMANTQRFTQDMIKTLKISKTPIVPPNIRLNKGSKITKLIWKSYTQIAISSPTQT